MRLALPLLLVSAVASANKPAPKNLKVFMDGGKIWATRDGVRIQAIDGRHTDYARVQKVELSDDGTTLFVWAGQCDIVGDDETKNELATSDLEAKFENALGMKAHLAKNYDQAIAHFTKAVAAYELPVYVTNLLSAQSMGKKLADADATLAKYGPHAPGWMAWRLAVDSDLVALKGRASTVPFAIAKPGTAHGAKDDAAYSPVGIAAMGTAEIPEGIGGDFESFVDIIDTASNTLMVHASLGITCFNMPDDPELAKAFKACERTNAPLRAKRAKEVDALLAQLGLQPVKTTGDAVAASFAVGKLTVSKDRNKGLNKCDDGIYYWTVSASATK